MDLLVAGSLEDILHGTVSYKTLFEIHPDQWVSGLGADMRMIEGQSVVAESVLIDHQVHSFCPQASWQESKVIKTPFYFGITERLKNKLSIHSPILLEEFFDDQIQEYPDGFILRGEVYFSALEAIYLKKPTIYGERLVDYSQKYVCKKDFKNCVSSIFGVVSSDYDERIFYEHPFEKKRSLLFTHVHAKIEEKVVHVLMHSELAKGEFWVEPLDEICAL